MKMLNKKTNQTLKTNTDDENSIESSKNYLRVTRMSNRLASESFENI